MSRHNRGNLIDIKTLAILVIMILTYKYSAFKMFVDSELFIENVNIKFLILVIIFSLILRYKVRVMISIIFFLVGLSFFFLTGYYIFGLTDILFNSEINSPSQLPFEPPSANNGTLKEKDNSKSTVIFLRLENKLLLPFP